MKLVGPERYKLAFNEKTFAITCSRGTAEFSQLACSKIPKLYIISVDGRPIYVGITKRPMRARLRFGFTAAGKGGYYGYAWRKQFREAILYIWAHIDSTDDAMLDLETIEAEVVFLARCSGQWPEGQTEIHFHPSRPEHRELADSIWKAVTNRTDLTG